MVPVVTNVYNAALKPKAEVYRSTYDAIALVESDHRLKALQTKGTLRVFASLYKSTRSAVLAVEPTKVLPKTLSAQTTDTDALYAIKTLVSAVKEYAGQAWADELLNGKFAQASTQAIEQVSLSYEASQAVVKAHADRAEAAEPAYQAFMAFKHVVRDALGSKSVQYRRLHGRRAGAREEEEEAAEGEKAATEGEKAATEPVNIAANGSANGGASDGAKGAVNGAVSGEETPKVAEEAGEPAASVSQS